MATFLPYPTSISCSDWLGDTGTAALPTTRPPFPHPAGLVLMPQIPSGKQPQAAEADTLAWVSPHSPERVYAAFRGSSQLPRATPLPSAASGSPGRGWG